MGDDQIATPCHGKLIFQMDENREREEYNQLVVSWLLGLS